MANEAITKDLLKRFTDLEDQLRALRLKPDPDIPVVDPFEPVSTTAACDLSIVSSPPSGMMSLPLDLVDDEGTDPPTVSGGDLTIPGGSLWYVQTAFWFATTDPVPTSKSVWVRMVEIISGTAAFQGVYAYTSTNEDFTASITGLGAVVRPDSDGMILSYEAEAYDGALFEFGGSHTNFLGHYKVDVAVSKIVDLG